MSYPRQIRESLPRNAYEGERRVEDGARRIRGYSRMQQGAARGSNLDEFYANQAGAAPKGDPAFAGQTGEDIAHDMATRGERTGFGGKGIEPAWNMSPNMRARLGHTPPASQDKDPFGLPYGPKNPRPVTDNQLVGTIASGVTGGAAGALGSMAANAATRMFPQGPYAPPTRPPVDPSTVRQPAPPVGPPTDAAGNPASESNPVTGTPAEFRQMARDAAIDRNVTTSGATGLTRPSGSIPVAGDPFGTGRQPVGPGNPFGPQDRPMQAADFRRTITSKYGTGTNETRQPGQGPAMTKDIMGRPATMQDFLADRKEVQASKDKNGWIAKAKEGDGSEEEDDQEEA